MADTFTNDLRVRLQEVGANSGTWGTLLDTTITNIAESWSYGTEALADSAAQTLTLADGASDELRSFYVKLTGTLSQATTVTIAPNTISKSWMIENATTGGYAVTISQGSGANVTVSNGNVKMIATDGAGAGGVVYDLFTDLELAGGATITVDDNSNVLTLKSTDADENSGPRLALTRDSGSPADNDFIGLISFNADDDGGNLTRFGYVVGQIIDASNGSEDGLLDFYTTAAGVETKTLTLSSGNVTIAGDLTGTGDTKFLATGDIGIGPRQGSATTGAVYIGGDTDNPFVSPTAIFTGDGKVGVGTVTPTTPLDVVSDSSANGIQMRGRSADNIGQFTFESNDSATTYAQIQSLSSELKIKTIANIPMSFHTNNTLAMTINSAGQVTIGSASHADDVLYLARSGTGKILRFYSSGAEVGYISSNTYSLPSDRNFKKDIEDLTLGLDFVNDLKPKQYRQKIEDSDVPLQTGLIAQDVEESLTAAGVSKNKYMMLQHTPDEDENVSQYGIDYGKLIPVLINAIQEQQTLIETLQTKVTALEEA